MVHHDRKNIFWLSFRTTWRTIRCAQTLSKRGRSSIIQVRLSQVRLLQNGGKCVTNEWQWADVNRWKVNIKLNYKIPLPLVYHHPLLLWIFVLWWHIYRNVPQHISHHFTIIELLRPRLDNVWAQRIARHVVSCREPI